MPPAFQTGALPAELEQHEGRNVPQASTLVNPFLNPSYQPISSDACQILPDSCSLIYVNIRSISPERAVVMTRTEAGPESRALSISEVGMIRKFLLWGAEDDDDGDGQDGDGQNDTQIVDEPSTKELTAEEIEKMTARAADRSARKARKNLAEELGFEDLNTFKDWVTTQREAEKEAMDEKDRAIKEAEEAQREAEALRNNLVSDRLDLAVQRHVIASGVSDEKKLQRVTALVRLDLDPDIVNDEEGWDEAITDALTAVKEDTPELFGDPGQKGYGSGDGGARGPSDKDEDKEAEKRKELEQEFADRGLIPYDA